MFSPFNVGNFSGLIETRIFIIYSYCLFEYALIAHELESFYKNENFERNEAIIN